MLDLICLSYGPQDQRYHRRVRIVFVLRSHHSLVANSSSFGTTHQLSSTQSQQLGFYN
jgi:hypothetical protein